MMFVWTTIGGIVLFLVISALVKAPGQSLSNKFAALGVVQGKSLAEIVQAVGNPNSISSTVGEDGQAITIQQWMATGYHIVLLFDENEICLGISSETAV